MLLEQNSSNPEFSYERFDIHNIKEPECKSAFRFENKNILVLADVLQLPDKFKGKIG